MLGLMTTKASHKLMHKIMTAPAQDRQEAIFSHFTEAFTLAALQRLS